MTKGTKQFNWSWVRSGLALAISSIPAWLTFFKIEPSVFKGHTAWIYHNVLIKTVPIPLPVLIGGIIFLLPNVWRSFIFQKNAGKNAKHFERTYDVENIRFNFYTYEGKSALRYQDEIYFKALCPTHLTELEQVRGDMEDGYGCLLCKQMIKESKFGVLQKHAKSKFLQDLKKSK